MTLRERWQAFAPRERYLMMGALAVTVVVVLRYAPIPALEGMSFSGGGDTWVQLQKIENYKKILARSDAVSNMHSEMAKRYDADQARLLSGTTPTQVGAELQGRLSSFAEDARLNVLSSQILREEEVGDFRRVGVRITLSGDLGGVVDMLSAIETGNTDVETTLLEVNRKLGASRRPTSSRLPSSSRAVIATPLTVTMEVKTFMQEPL